MVDRLNAVRPAWLFAAAFLPVLVLAAWHWSGGPGVAANDYAQYILHGRALAGGRPYGDIGYLFTPFNGSYGPPVREPGLPLLLAVLFRLFGPGLQVPRLVLLATGLSFCGLAGGFFAKRATLPVGLGVTLFTGVSASVVVSLSQVQTDLPLALLVWSVVLLYDVEGQLSTRRLAAITVVGTLAILFRTAGVALIPAALFYALANRRRAGNRAVLPPVLWLLAGVVDQALAPSAGSFVAMYTRMAGRLYQHPGSFLGVQVGRVLRYRVSFHYATLYPFPSDAVNNVYHVVAGILAIVGGVVLYRRVRGGFLPWFVGFYLALVLLSPVGGGSRYMIPLQPVLTAAFLLGLVEVGQRARLDGSRAGWGALAVAALLAVGAASQTLDRQGWLADLPEARGLFDRIRADARSTPRMRVAFSNALVLTEQTGVSAMPLFVAPPDTVIAVVLRRCITHVVLGDPVGTSAASTAFQRAAQGRPELFEEQYRNAKFTLLRVAESRCPQL
jgi:hypothetical protein